MDPCIPAMTFITVSPKVMVPYYAVAGQVPAEAGGPDRGMAALVGSWKGEESFGGWLMLVDFECLIYVKVYIIY